jgi:hypothetical protein
MYRWTAHQCAKNLVNTLEWWCKTPLDFKGHANGRVWAFEADFDDRAQLLFTSDRGDGRIELFVAEDNWVRAELFIGDEMKLRAWIEDPYEEKEFWPDGSNGEPDAQGDAAGRISKRGAWLQIRCADFPGVPDDGGGYFDLKDTFD